MNDDEEKKMLPGWYIVPILLLGGSLIAWVIAGIVGLIL